MFLKLLLISIFFLGLAFAGFAVKMFFKKDGEFKKSCSSVHPKTGERIGCVCGGEGGDSCHNKTEEIVTKIQTLDIKIETLKVD